MSKSRVAAFRNRPPKEVSTADATLAQEFPTPYGQRVQELQTPRITTIPEATTPEAAAEAPSATADDVASTTGSAIWHSTLRPYHAPADDVASVAESFVNYAVEEVPTLGCGLRSAIACTHIGYQPKP